ncbi:ABC transporter permease, partial [bacterium]
MIDRLLFILGEALTALRRNLGMTFAAVSTVALSLFVLGGLGLAYLAVAGYARTLPGRFEMRAYLK